MILGTREIKQRLKDGEIFRKGSCVKSSVKEASYALTPIHRKDEVGVVLKG